MSLKSRSSHAIYWLSKRGIREALAEAEADIAAGTTVGSEELRRRLGIAGK